MSDKVVQERTKRLSRLAQPKSVRRKFPLLLEFEINKELFKQLRAAVNQYLLATLNRFNSTKVFPYEEDAVEAYYEELAKLPNITPNGIVLPKNETILEFNLVHMALVRVIQNFHIEHFFKSAHVPVSLRLVDGNMKANLASRPYASTKIHSDLWAGHTCDCLVFLPILGDMGGTRVDFFEPIGVKPDYGKTLSDYDEGRALFTDMEKYNCLMKKSFAYFKDSYLLHQTIKQGGGPRLSIDFQLTFKGKRLKSDFQKKSDREKNFVSMEKWCDVGKRWLIVENETLGESARKFQHGKPPKSQTSYASRHLHMIKIV